MCAKMAELSAHTRLDGAAGSWRTAFRPAALVGAVASFGAAVVAMGGVSLSGAVSALMAYLLGVALFSQLAARHYPVARFGWANCVTLWRAGLIAGLVAPLATGAPGGWGVAIVAVIALSMDGVDGFLARRQGLQTRFGARFDMEVDALFAAVLAAHAALAGLPILAMLVLGGARYLFALAGWVAPWLAAPLPDRLWRKAVCVVQLGVLIAVQLPFWPESAAGVLVSLAAIGLVLSFAVDIRWLYARRS